MKKLQNLPVGDSSFENIRGDECVYVDKTRHIFEIADGGSYYFMSRLGVNFSTEKRNVLEWEIAD